MIGMKEKWTNRKIVHNGVLSALLCTTVTIDHSEPIFRKINTATNYNRYVTGLGKELYTEYKRQKNLRNKYPYGDCPDY
jgi:hypothetical protein